MTLIFDLFNSVEVSIKIAAMSGFHSVIRVLDRRPTLIEIHAPREDDHFYIDNIMIIKSMHKLFETSP